MDQKQKSDFPFRICGFALVLWLILAVGGTVEAKPDNQQPKTGTSLFHIQKDAGGKYWFVDPQGNRFLSIGINNIVPEPFRPRPDTQYYKPVANQFDGDFEAWKKDVLAILQEHSFNTIGAWSDGRLYKGPVYGTVCLYVAGYAQDRCLDGLRPGFEERVRENTKIMMDQYPYCENVLGIFLDNEMPWYGHAHWGEIPNYTLLESALSLPAEDGARLAAMNFLQQLYPSIEALSKAWGKPVSSWDQVTMDYARSCMNKQVQADREAFIALAAEAFYKTACTTVRDILPGTLILGSRFAGYAPVPVVRACGRYCDVISFNNYRADPSADPEMLTRFWIWGGKKPLMITEFSWRAEENTSGNPNTGGAGAIVKTQTRRAENYQKYVEDLLAYPMVIGAHWFEFSDQSPQGRFDGENSNYGIVDIHHRPYTELLTAMKQTNQRIHKLHADAGRKAPDELPKPKPVVFQASQHPDRPPFIDLISVIPAAKPELFQAPDALIRSSKQWDSIILDLETGKDWGCGILFFGPKEWKISKETGFATNLDGYTAVEIEALIPKSLTFDFLLDEAGVNRPDAVSYDRRAGDDGESFMISSLQGSGEQEIYRLELKNLLPRTSWGNQKGERKVDIHALKGMCLLFHGGQGTAQVRLFALKLVR